MTKNKECFSCGKPLTSKQNGFCKDCERHIEDW